MILCYSHHGLHLYQWLIWFRSVFHRRYQQHGDNSRRWSDTAGWWGHAVSDYDGGMVMFNEFIILRWYVFALETIFTNHVFLHFKVLSHSLERMCINFIISLAVSKCFIFFSVFQMWSFSVVCVFQISGPGKWSISEFSRRRCSANRKHYSGSVIKSIWG